MNSNNTQLMIADQDAADSTAALFARCRENWRPVIIEREKLMQQFDAENNRQAVAQDYAARLGKSEGSLRRMYYGWKQRGIEALAPKKAFRKMAAEKGRGLPPEFVEYFRTICESITSDSVPQARRILIQRIVGGEYVPGFGTWRTMWATRFPNIPPPRGVGAEYPRDNIESLLPRGLSPRNLNRHKGELFDLTSARQGTWAAHKYAPQVYTTRVGVKAGQVLIFDDVWHNQKVNFMGSSKSLRPIELCCVDLLSAHKVAWGARPRLWNPETKRHETVKDHEFRFLLAYTLCEAVGYRPDGTYLWVERGTASIDDELAEILSALSGGAIKRKAAPLKDARQLCSIFRSVGSGNPQFKTHLESHHSIAQTALSHLPGQVGRSASVQPEELFGRDKANELMIKVAALLPPELASQLEMPVLHWDEYMDCVFHAYNELAWREWHSLEGWERLRHYKKVFSLPGYTDECPLSSLSDMPPDAADGIRRILDQHPEWIRTAPMAPIEVWQKHRNEMTLLPKCAIPLILGAKNGVVRQCPQSAEIKFSSRSLGPAPHIYSREYIDEYGQRRRLQANREYLFHINPFSPARELFISDPSGSYLGSTGLISVPCRVDEDGVRDAIKRQTAEYARMARRVSGRHLSQRANQALAMQRNARLVNQAVDQGLLTAGTDEDKNNARAVPAGCSEDADEAILELYGE